MAVNQILSNIYGILVLWRKQSGTFSFSFKMEFLDYWINFFFLFFNCFFLGAAPPAHVIPEEGCELSSTDCPKFLHAFVFLLRPPLFPGKLGKVTVRVLSHPRSFLLVQEETGIQLCRNIPIAVNGWQRQHGWDCSCVPVQCILLTQGRACWAVVMFYGTIFQSRNVNHCIWNPCKRSPFLNQMRYCFVCSTETASTVLLNNTIKPVWVLGFFFFFAKTEIPVALESWPLQI